MSNEKAALPGAALSEPAAARKLLKPEDSGRRADVLPMRPRWSQALIDGADGPVPSYGSAAWSALPDDSRVKVAATVLAAEAWRTRHVQPDFVTPIGSRRAREIADARRPRPGDHQGGPVEWDGVASGA